MTENTKTRKIRKDKRRRNSRKDEKDEKKKEKKKKSHVRVVFFLVESTRFFFTMHRLITAAVLANPRPLRAGAIAPEPKPD